MKDTQLLFCEVSGLLKDLLEKLSGDNGDQWLRVLNKMLRKENPWEVFSTIWKIIKLGTCDSVDKLRKAFGENDYRISNWADDILKKVEISSVETDADLMVATTDGFSLVASSFLGFFVFWILGLSPVKFCGTFSFVNILLK